MGGTIEQQYSSSGEQKSNLPAIQKNLSLMKSSQKDGGLKSRGSNRTNGGSHAGGGIGLGGPIMHHGANDSTVGSTAVGANASKNVSNRVSNHQIS